MGIYSQLFGYSKTSTSSADAYNSNLTPSGSAAPAIAALGPYAIAINGVQFTVDTSFEPYRREAFRHKSIPAQRQSINLTNISGQGTVNTEGLWRREQTDWAMGSGQLSLDRKGDSQETRFYQSKGVDPFSSPYQLTLLNDVAKKYTTSATNVLTSRCGNAVFIVDGATVKSTTDWSSFTTYTFSTSGAYTAPTVIRSIDSSDAYVFLATDTGIFYMQEGVGTVFYGFAKPDSGTYAGGYSLVRWCNDQVIAASYQDPTNSSLGNRLYAFQPGHVTFPNGGTPTTGAAPTGSDTLTTHANPYWVWSDATGGETQVYFTGYVQQSGAKYSGCVYRSGYTLNTSGVIQPFSLNTPVQALPMSPDEVPLCIQSYLNFIFVGTSQGIRMCQTLSIYDPTATATGDLKAGPLIPNILGPSVNSGVTAITGDGRFVWFAWNNYDTISTGLGKLDLSTFVNGDPLTPVYASDLMATGQGIVNSLDWDFITSGPMFAVSGKGVYTQNSTKYVTSGTINSGLISYGIPDQKIPVFFDYGATVPSGGQVQAFLAIDPKSPNDQGTLALPGITTSATTEVTVPSGYRAEQFQVSVTLSSDSTQATTPILYRWTLKSWPAAVSETAITVVIQLFSVNVVDGLEQFVDPYRSFYYLESLRQSQQIVTYQEGPLTANVIVEALDWLPHKRRDNYENGFEGDCVVTLKTIGGYITPTTYALTA